MYSSSKLISVKEAGEKISKYMKVIEDKEVVATVDAFERVCAEDVYSPMDNPPFNRSEVDGFAVRTAEFKTHGGQSTTTLDIGGTVEIGIATPAEFGENTCVRISTGSIVPKGYDAVFKIEDVTVKGNKVIFKGKPPKFSNIALAGSDVLKDDLIIRQYSKITEKEIGALAVLGIEKITVFRKVRIGIISSGNELIMPGNELQPGQTYEGNAAVLRTILGKYHFFNTVFYGIVPDSEEDTRNILEKAFSENDVVITTGGSSAGEKDYIGRIAASYNPGVIFHGIDMKPGKPTFFALNGKKILIGLPGFPLSSYIAFTQIFLYKLLGMAHVQPILTETDVQLAMGISARKGGTNFIPVVLYIYDSIYAFPIDGESGSISRLLRSDAIGEVVAKSDRLFPGDTVTITTIEGEQDFLWAVFVGLTDPLMDTIFSISGNPVSMYRTSIEDGMRCLEEGYAPLMGIMVKAGRKPPFKNKDKYSFFKIFSSETGLVFRNGDPIISDDFDHKNEIVVGIPGNGIYPQESIEKCIESIPSAARPPGFSTVDYGDLRSIALAVRSGDISIGLGNRHTASKYNLGFKPVYRETYYVVVTREQKQEFIDTMKKAYQNGALKVLKEKYGSYEIHDDVFLPK